MIIGERIKMLRTEAGITQSELAKVLNISSKSVISYHESGKITPNMQTQLLLCKYFNVTIDYLLGHSDIRYYDENAKPVIVNTDDVMSPEAFIRRAKLMFENEKISTEDKDKMFFGVVDSYRRSKLESQNQNDK